MNLNMVFFEVAFHRDATLGGAGYAGNALCAKFVEQDVGKGHFSHEVYRGCRIIVLLHHAQNIVDCPDCHDFYLGSGGLGRYIWERHVHDLTVGFCGFALGGLPTGVWVIADVDEHFFKFKFKNQVQVQVAELRCLFLICSMALSNPVCCLMSVPSSTMMRDGLAFLVI